ncbi:MAG TPA: hypothetical protein VGB66_11430, partial [Longimicrobium sp.]
MDNAPAAPLEMETDRLVLRTLGPGDEDRLQRVFERCADHVAALTGRPAPDPGAAAAELRASTGSPGRQVALLTRLDTGEEVGAVGWWAGNPEPDRALLGLLM